MAKVFTVGSLTATIPTRDAALNIGTTLRAEPGTARVQATAWTGGGTPEIRDDVVRSVIEGHLSAMNRLTPAERRAVEERIGLSSPGWQASGTGTATPPGEGSTAHLDAGTASSMRAIQKMNASAKSFWRDLQRFPPSAPSTGGPASGTLSRIGQMNAVNRAFWAARAR